MEVPEGVTGISDAFCGARKLAGEMDAGTSPGFLSATAKDGSTLDLVVGADGIAGVFGDYGIDGARNVFSSRDAWDREWSSYVLRQFSYESAVNLAWESTREGDGTPCGWNGLSVKVGSTGRTKVTGAFKYYVESARGAPAAKTVNVYGVVVEGVGYGTAVVRGKGAVSVTVE